MQKDANTILLFTDQRAAIDSRPYMLTLMKAICPISTAR